MPKTIGVILSGCGVYDGAEIHEAVCTMLALDRAGVEMVLMAPDRDQMHVVNHLSGEPAEGESRNVLVESARIARGNVKDVATVNAAALDGVILPGGFGAAKNLSDFATAGDQCQVDPGVATLLRDTHAAGKPIAALCIAPAVIASLFGRELNPRITIGNDADTAKALESMGARHADTPVSEIVIDAENRIITTPCYMLAGRISEVAEGADLAVSALLEMVGQSQTAVV